MKIHPLIWVSVAVLVITNENGIVFRGAGGSERGFWWSGRGDAAIRVIDISHFSQK